MEITADHPDLNQFFANHQNLWGSRMDALVGLVENSIMEPNDLIKRGEVPVSYIFAIEPTSDDEKVHRAFESLMSAAGMIRFFAAVNELSDYDNQSRKETYSIKNPEEIALAFEEAASATMASLTKGQVGAVYNVQTTQTGPPLTLNKSRSEIRQDVINFILADVPDVSSSVINKVNEAFTDFIRKIRPFRVSEESGLPTVNHCVVVHYVAMSAETDTGASPIPEPKTRIVYFKCKAGDWDRAMQKPDDSKKDEKIPFTMDILVKEMTLDETLFRRRKGNWETMARFIAENKDDVKEVVESEGIEGFGRKTAFVFEA